MYTITEVQLSDRIQSAVVPWSTGYITLQDALEAIQASLFEAITDEGVDKAEATGILITTYSKTTTLGRLPELGQSHLYAGEPMVINYGDTQFIITWCEVAEEAK
jgi:hypothetical protein